MKIPLLRSLLAVTGASLSLLAAAQSTPDFFLPDDSHLLLFTSAGTFSLSNEQKVSWSVDPAQEKSFEAWRKKLPGHPEMSQLVKDLLGKNKKLALKAVGTVKAQPPSSGSIALKFAFANGKPDANLSLMANSNGKDWSPPSDASAVLTDIATGLGLRDRDRLEPSMRTAGDGGKPWTHLVRMVETYPTSYLPIGHSGVLTVTRDETVIVPTGTTGSGTTGTADGPKTQKPAVADKAKGEDSSLLIYLVGGLVVVLAGVAGFFFGRKSSGGSEAAPVDKSGLKVVRVNPEEYKLLVFFQGEASRKLTTTAEAADREEALQTILTRYRGYPELDGQLRALKQSTESLNEQVRLLTFYKSYADQPEAFRAQHERLEADFESAKERLSTAEAKVKTLEANVAALTREKTDLDKNLKIAQAELATAETLLDQQVQALDSLAADLAKLKERIQA